MFEVMWSFPFTFPTNQLLVPLALRATVMYCPALLLFVFCPIIATSLMIEKHPKAVVVLW
jgi:hypothetical protein